MNHWPPPPPVPFSALGTIAELDALKRTLFDLIRSVDTARNGLTLINSRLPPEILLHVFEALANMHDLGRPPRSKNEMAHHYKWIAVTHVCRSWRNLALGCPSLWARVSLSSQQAAQAFLERSGQHIPLTLWNDAGVPARYLSDYGHRVLAIGTLSVGEADPHYIQSACAGKRLQLPLLECLHAETSPRSDNIAELSEAHMPRLKRLSLHCRHSFGMTLLRPTLTHLEVNGCMASPTASLAISKWLKLLRGLPVLQEVHLYDAISSNDSSRTPSSAVELPQLRLIALRQSRGHTTSTLCAHLLAHLSYPMTAETHLLVSQPALDFEAYARVVSVACNRVNLHKLASSLHLPLYTHLSLVAHEAHGFGGTIELMLTSNVRSGLPSPGPLSITLLLKRDSFHGPIWGVDAYRAADEALCYLAATPLAAEVTHLSLNAPLRPTRGNSNPVADYYRTWLHLHATGLRLQSLSLSASIEHMQLQAFLKAVQTSLDAKTAFFPELRTLTVRGLDPRGLVDGLAVPRSLEWNLVRAFQERRKRGGGPTFLKLEDGFSKEMDRIRLLKASDEGEPIVDFFDDDYY